METGLAEESNIFMIVAKKRAAESRCKKMQTGTCLVTGNGYVLSANNDTGVYVSECPRMEMPTGVGYELCKDVCKQEGHTEIRVLRKADDSGIDTRGSELFLWGHWYCCDPCIGAMERAGVKKYYVLPESYYKEQIKRWGARKPA